MKARPDQSCVIYPRLMNETSIFRYHFSLSDGLLVNPQFPVWLPARNGTLLKQQEIRPPPAFIGHSLYCIAIRFRVLVHLGSSMHSAASLLAAPDWIWGACWNRYLREAPRNLSPKYSRSQNAMTDLKCVSENPRWKREETTRNSRKVAWTRRLPRPTICRQCLVCGVPILRRGESPIRKWIWRPLSRSRWSGNCVQILPVLIHLVWKQGGHSPSIRGAVSRRV